MNKEFLHNRKSILFFFFIVISFFFFNANIQNADAQITLPGNETLLVLNPETPQAGQRFTARVEAYSYDIKRAIIAWDIDGVIQQDLNQEQQITLTAPQLGESMTVRVQVTEQNGLTHTATQTIRPSAIDIIIESDTQVPTFYRGRALPSSGSTVRLIAFPSIYTTNGSIAPARDLTYTWTINSRVVKSGPGNNVLLVSMSDRDSLIVQLTVETLDGAARQSNFIQVSASTPENIFYEDNPLYGLSRNALPPDLTFLSDEVTIHAEPYYMANDVFDNAQYTWKINGAVINNQSTDPRSITLRKTGSVDSARIEFSVRNLKAILQSATGAFTVYFRN